MKKCKTCGQEKPLSDFYIRKESGRHRSECKSCQNKSASKWARENPEKRRAVALKWAKENYDYIRANKAKYRAEDPLKMRKWERENPEKMKACRARWNAANKDRKAEHTATRRSRQRQAMPAWADRFVIAEAYRLARLRTEIFGFQWEVDHIVPLAGKTVCGLHVEHNLQVIPMSTNRRKSRSHWPDMP